MIHEKSKERVKQLGEIYTPPEVANKMLDMLNQDEFGDELVVYFEPSCGNGNIVIEILKRRLEAYSKKYSRSQSVALAINNLWAIDIDEENIIETRHRVFELFEEFCKDEVLFKDGGADTIWAMLLATTIQDHIFVADFFSSMEADPIKAEEASRKTRMGRECYLKHGHKPMPFLFESKDKAA